MAEEVVTGGLMKFRYDKREKTSELKSEEKREIRDAYDKHYEKKRKARRRKMMLIILVLIILAGGLLAFFLS